MASTLTRAPDPVDSPPAVPALAYRPALDGLRAVAVLAVIAYHLEIPGFRGGFLGVDLFFVLSGALITALLLLEHDGRGRIDIVRFWARRARRLLPAVLLLLIVVVPLARADIGIRGDALATLGYVANWRFAAQARSYFAEAAAMSPLNHMWSLAIEEQFYVVWPLFVAALVRSRRVVLGGMMVLAVASVATMAWLYTLGDPSVAYYHTFARIHELVVGALAAFALLGSSARAMRLRAVAGRLTPIAAAAVLVALATVDDAAAPYYLGVSLAFSVAVAVVILGLEGSARRLRAALSWGPLVWVGTLSYGLYLWHWPFVVLVRRVHLSGPMLGVAVVTMTFAAAYVSARIVEQPIRTGRVRSFDLTPVRTLVAAAVGLALVAGAVVVATPVSLQPSWTRAETGDPVVVEAPVAVAASHPDAVERSLTAEHDDGEPGPADDLPAGAADEPLVIGVVGDSAAASMLPGIAAAAERRGDEVVSVAARGCPMIPVWQVDERGHSLSYSKDCRRHVQKAFTKLVDRHDPDIVIWYSGRDTQTRFMTGGEMVDPSDPDHTTAVRRGFERAAEQLTARGAQLVIVRSLPRHGSPVSDCSRPPAQGERWCDRVDRYAGPDGQNALYEELAQRHDDIHLIAEAELVCGSGSVCDDRMTDEETWRTDLTHFGEHGALRVGEAIVTDALAAAART